MATIFAASHRQIREKFLAGYPVDTRSFYEQYYSADLLRLQAGLERDFDAACGGDKTRQPKPWLMDRLQLISQILEERIPTHAEQMGDRVKSKLAKPVTKFNQ